MDNVYIAAGRQSSIRWTLFNEQPVAVTRSISVLVSLLVSMRVCLFVRLCLSDCTAVSMSAYVIEPSVIG